MSRPVERRFMIVSNPRSGSMYLASLLNSHPDILCHNELFNKKPLDSVAYKYRSKKSLPDMVEGYSFRSGFPETFLDLVLKDYPVCGFKIICNQIEGLIRDRVVMDKAFMKIVLVRKNIVRKYVSEEIAMINGVWSSITKKNELMRIPVERKKLMDYVQSDRNAIEFFINSFKERAHDYCVVSYEDLGSSQTIEFLQNFLGVKPAPLVTKLVRQNPYSLKEMIENYEELKRELAGTEYEKMLEE